MDTCWHPRVAVMDQAVEGLVFRGDGGMFESFQREGVSVLRFVRVAQPVIRPENALITNAVSHQPLVVRTQVISVTHSWFGTGAWNCRWTKSGR